MFDKEKVRVGGWFRRSVAAEGRVPEVSLQQTSGLRSWTSRFRLAKNATVERRAAQKKAVSSIKIFLKSDIIEKVVTAEKDSVRPGKRPIGSKSRNGVFKKTSAENMYLQNWSMSRHQNISPVSS